MTETTTEREARLPEASPSNPECGACGDETEFDGDDFTCDDCGLWFNTSTMRPSLADPDAPACGASCDHDAEDREMAARRLYAYQCEPCALSEGHASPHWNGCRLRHLDDETDG